MMSYKVLLVDDERCVTAGLKRQLRGEPYQILEAGSGAEALTILAEEQVDVIISDEQMPGMPGSEFLTQVRRAYPDTIRIILTGHASIESAVQAINEGGIYRYLLKPCSPLEMASTIRQALEAKASSVARVGIMRGQLAQESVLAELEQAHPGISKVECDDDGAVIIDGDDA